MYKFGNPEVGNTLLRRPAYLTSIKGNIFLRQIVFRDFWSLQVAVDRDLPPDGATILVPSKEDFQSIAIAAILKLRLEGRWQDVVQTWGDERLERLKRMFEWIDLSWSDDPVDRNKSGGGIYGGVAYLADAIERFQMPLEEKIDAIANWLLTAEFKPAAMYWLCHGRSDQMRRLGPVDDWLHERSPADPKKHVLSDPYPDAPRLAVWIPSEQAWILYERPTLPATPNVR